MNIINKKLKDITPYKNNAKKHNKTQINNVAESIKQFGMVQPIVLDKNNEIVIGHCRYEALKKLKRKEAPCVMADDLTDDQIKKLRNLDNKLNESEWDFDLLEFDIQDLDFSDFDIDWGIPDLDDNEEKEIIEDDFDIEPPAEPKSKLGDIYQLGNHRLMCGDSTSICDVEKLINNNKIELLITDPPYNMINVGKGCFAKSNENMKKRIENLVDFDAKSIEFIKNMDIGSYYLFTSKELIPQYFEIFKGYKFNILIWCKTNPTPWVNNNFLPDVEYCLYFHKRNRIWNNGLKPTEKYKKYYISDKLDGRKEDGDLHPTMKPLEMLRNKIEISSNKGGNVLDLFGGSGSTLIACEQLNRNCYMMELDPKYVDVIIERWEKFTGVKAVLLNE